MYNLTTRFDSIIKDLKKLNLNELEKIQLELTKVIEIKKEVEEVNKNNKKQRIKEIKEKYDNDEYVCIYQPYDSYNWFIESNPDFNNSNNYGIPVNCFVEFVLKTELNKYIK